MPEISFPVEDEQRPEVEADPAPEVEVSPDIEVIFEDDPAGSRRRALAARIVVAAIVLVGLVATGWLIIDSGSDSVPEPAGSVTSPGTTQPGVSENCGPFGSPNVVRPC